MFHSVGLENHAWRSQYISEPIEVMESKLKAIEEEGYEAIFMGEAHNLRNSKSDNFIHLNFDDGYLDNWVHLFPLLKKYSLKGTIFMTSDFIDKKAIVRTQHSIDSHYQLGASECCAGFLSFEEMREMEKSGLIEIQSHAKSHTWYFKGNKIIDFWRPGIATEVGGPVWMLWNKFPEEKQNYLTNAADLETLIPYGTPIYEHGKSLETYKFFPKDEELKKKLIAKVLKKKNFFENIHWRIELEAIVADFGEISGNIETERDFEIRVREELVTSKRILEEGLKHTIDGICWPGGGIDKKVVQIAEEVGYKYFTLPSKWKKAPDVLFSKMIPRIGPLANVYFNGYVLGRPSKKDFKLYLRMHNGEVKAKLMFLIKRLIKYVQIKAFY